MQINIVMPELRQIVIDGIHSLRVTLTDHNHVTRPRKATFIDFRDKFKKTSKYEA